MGIVLARLTYGQAPALCLSSATKGWLIWLEREL